MAKTDRFTVAVIPFVADCNRGVMIDNDEFEVTCNAGTTLYGLSYLGRYFMWSFIYEDAATEVMRRLTMEKITPMMFASSFVGDVQETQHTTISRVDVQRGGPFEMERTFK